VTDATFNAKMWHGSPLARALLKPGAGPSSVGLPTFEKRTFVDQFPRIAASFVVARSS
jgi:hypothetical protein